MKFILFFFLQIPLFAQTPLAYYPMDSQPIDASGNKNHGKIMGGVTPTMDRFGNPCGAFLFNGTDGYLEIPNSPTLQSPTNGFSVTAWFKIGSASCAGDIRWLTLLCKGENATETDNNPQYRFQTLQAQNQSTISINTDFTEFDDSYQQHGFGYDIWHFYALTYDGNTVKAFLNGAKIWEFPYNKSFTPNNSPLFIGKDVPGSLEYFCGSLDDVRIFGASLSDSQVFNFFQETSQKTLNEDFDFACIPNQITHTDKAICAATVRYTTPNASISCGDVQIKQLKGLASGAVFSVGKHSLVFEAKSTTGIVKTCYSTITVEDKEVPQIICPSDTTIFIAPTQNDAVVRYATPKAFDNCKLESVQLKSGLANGAKFPLGITPLIFEAKDAAGNTAQCGFHIEVKQQQAVTKVLKTDSVKIVPQISVVKDSVKQTYHLETNDCMMTLVLYDDIEQDDDTVSVFFNGKEIIKREQIRLEANGTINKAIMLIQDEVNELVIKAWNTGRVSPNTLKIEFHEGYWLNDPKKLKKHKPISSRIINSRPGMSSRVTLKCKGN